MRELALFEQFLLKLRQEKLQASHSTLVNNGLARDARTLAHEADLCTRITLALKVLDKDAGQFIKDFLT